jgi:hypothetical protein
VKKILITVLIVISSMSYAEGVIEDPAKIGLTVKSEGLALSDRTISEIRNIRANNPLGPVSYDLARNKKDFSHLNEAYKKLSNNIKIILN